MRRKITILALGLLMAFTSFGQKRNMVGNARFEDGIKNWRYNLGYDATATGVVLDTVTGANAIQGNMSIRATVNETLTNTWDYMFRYFLPISKGERYNVSFDIKATGTDSVYFEFCQTDYPYTALLRQWVKVNTSVTTFDFTTEASTLSDWNYELNFHLGQQPVGAILVFDNIKITMVDSDWDGNLLPAGDLDSGSDDGFILNSNTSVATVVIDSNNVMDGNSIHINKIATGSWWDASMYLLYWSNEGVYHSVSFDAMAASSSSTGMITIRTNEDPWGPSGDNYVSYPTITDTRQTFVIDSATDQYGNNHASLNYFSFDDYYWGAYKIFSGLGDDGTPVGFDVYIDNIKVKEMIAIESIEVDGPTTIDSTVSLSDYEDIWATPTNAINTVTWSITNSTGEASLQDSKIVPLQPGIIYLVATSTEDSNIKDSIAITVDMKAVSSITVTGTDGATSIDTDMGTLQMIATIDPTDALWQDYTWSVDNSQVASISSTGKLRAIRNGEVIVKATSKKYPNISGSLTITISNQSIRVETVTIIGADNVTEISTDNGTLQMEATVLPEYALDKSVTWSVAQTNLASIDAETGLLTAIANGIVTVTAIANDGSDASGSTNITLNNQVVIVSSIELVGKDGLTTITTDGGTLHVSATVYPYETDNKDLTWNISDEELATIDQNGLVTAIKNGTITVTAAAQDTSGISGSMTITISGQITLIESIVLSTESNITTISTDGGTLQISATVSPWDASNQSVTYSVSDESLASVSTSGLVTAIKDGTVTIKATAQDGSGISGSIDINISNQVGIKNQTIETVHCYPNPTSNNLTVDNTNNLQQIQIIDMNGKILKAIEVTSETIQIDVTNLAKGTYILRAISTDSLYMARFIKE